MEIQCPAPNCSYTTAKLEPPLSMQLLEMHHSSVHIATHTSTAPSCKPETVPRPRIDMDISETAWRDFSSQWVRYKRSTGVTGQDAADQLISCCSDALRMTVNSEVGDITLDESAIMEAIQLIAVRRSNPMVHRNKLRDMKQGEEETFRNYISRLKEAAIDCKFTIPCTKQGCKAINSYAEEMIRDQAVYGIASSDTQAKILALGSTLPSLNDVILKAEAEEQAMTTQAKITLSHQADVTARRTTAYKANKRSIQRPNPNTPATCYFCGSTGHGRMPNRDEREANCPAWNVTCDYCKKKGHMSSVCRAARQDQNSPKPTNVPAVGAMPTESPTVNVPSFCNLASIPGVQQSSGTWKLGHVEWAEERGWYKTEPTAMPKIPLDIEVMCSEHHSLHPQSLITETSKHTSIARNWHCTPDTGAQVTVSGPKLLTRLNVRHADLIPVSQNVSTANNVPLTILGAIVVKLSSMTSPRRSTLQLCYISKECHGMYLSLTTCKSLGIVPATFPQPSPQTARVNGVTDTTKEEGVTISCKRIISVSDDQPTAPCGCPIRAQPPPLPTEMPFPATDTERLKHWILERYSASAFNTCCTQPLPAMHGDPLVIAIKPGTTPSAIHVPGPVPIHFQAEVKKGLDRDVALGVLEKVPVNTPVEWLHRMVITPKKDGSPRRTVDLQALNRASVRQTHHTASPFHTAASIPTDVKKTCLDAWNGYHSVLLDEKSRKLTSFITPWGVYRYRTAPQGYLASGDAYTHRYDNIVRDVHDIAKCVDDVCLWSPTTEENFMKTCKYLHLCSTNGIIFNPEKFVFSKDEVDFLGFKVTKDSLKPADHMLQAIKKFPTPTDISGIRSFFGLVNQVSYAFAMTDTMTPFRDLLKPSTPFYWDEALQKLFQDAKSEIIKQIVNGVNMFDKNRITCLATDWSKSGIGYFLSQKHCTCEEITPSCCRDGWKLVLAGSRFTKPAESHYHPVEGEALAVAYALQKTRYYIQGCKQLIVATDHRPLLKIFGDRSLEDITNPRLLNFKEKSLQYRFQMVYVPGKKNDGPDSMSRNPSDVLPTHPDDALLSTIRVNEEDPEGDPAAIAITSAIDQIQAVSVERVAHETSRDPSLQNLIKCIQDGFPSSKELCTEDIREYFRHRDDLSICDGVVLYKTRVLIPCSLRKEILECLHAAHQGVQGMKARAAQTVFWPGISGAISDTRARCRTCSTITPSHPAEPPITSEPPQYPYEQVCADYFELGGFQYLAMADRYSGWLSVKCFPRGQATASALISTLREWFMLFGAPKQLASDGGTTFTSSQTQQFFKTWGIFHRVSSVAFPHSNCRAELAVKTAKRLIRDNAGPHGSLDTDKFARALMQYRNTPLQDINLSPAQILLGRNIRDFFPFLNSKCTIRKEWQIAAEDREKALARKHATQHERLSLHTRKLPPLQLGDTVLIQNQTGNHPTRWDRTGVVIEAGPGPRQYLVRTDGSGRMSLRNRKFLRKCNSIAKPPLYTPVTPWDPIRHSHADDTALPQDVSPTEQEPEVPPTPPSPIPLPDATTPEQHIHDTPPACPDPQQQPTRTEPQPPSTPPPVRRSTRRRKLPDRYGDYVTH